TRSASGTASRRCRSSGVVDAAMVTHKSRDDIKKASSTGQAEEAVFGSRMVSDSGQGRRPFRLGVIPPSKSKRHVSRVGEPRRGRGGELHRRQQKKNEGTISGSL